LKAGDSAENTVAGWSADLAAFERMRGKYFLYK